MVFYLKVNRMESWAMKCLQHWIDIIEAMSDVNKIYLLCDKNEVKKLIVENIKFRFDSYEFLDSYRCLSEITHIVLNVANKKWSNAAYAHLTTFLHADQNGFKRFWNIDADDTYFCLSPERVGELLQNIETYSFENKIDIFSLDMWRTRTEGEHWSFGVTYTNNKVEWFDVMKSHCEDLEYKNLRWPTKNIDLFFTYLKAYTNLKLETFYAENLRFIHYSEDFFYYLNTSGFYHWKNGKLYLPILLYCISMEKKSQLPITEDIIKFDINIKDNECSQLISSHALETLNGADELLEKIPAGVKIIIYGARKNGSLLAREIRKTGKCEVVCIIDRNYTEMAIENIEICSVDMALQNYTYDYIVISSSVRTTYFEIKDILLEQGVKKEKIISLFNL